MMYNNNKYFLLHKTMYNNNIYLSLYNDNKDSSLYESLFSLYTFLYNENVYRHYIRKRIMTINFLI